MMKKPDGLKIGCYEYKINYKKEIRSDKGDMLYGEIRECDQVIDVNNSSSIIRQKATILHESMHGIGYDCCINLSERQVEAISNGLFRFMRENKELVKYIIS